MCACWEACWHWLFWWVAGSWRCGEMGLLTSLTKQTLFLKKRQHGKGGGSPCFKKWRRDYTSASFDNVTQLFLTVKDSVVHIQSREWQWSWLFLKYPPPAFLFSLQSVDNSRLSQCHGCQSLSFLPVQMSSFQNVLVSYFRNSEIC